MASISDEILHDFSPLIKVYKDGRVERLEGEDVVPASTDPETGVESKDIVFDSEKNLSARLYLPKNADPNHKLPLLIYFHGGGFLIGSAFSPIYQNHLNALVAEANVVAVSVNYRLAPEFPLPIAYEDSWLALKWVASHSTGDGKMGGSTAAPTGPGLHCRLTLNGNKDWLKECDGNTGGCSKGSAVTVGVAAPTDPGQQSRLTLDGKEPWLKEYADFNRVYLGGDSAGGNIAHNMAIRAGLESLDGVNINGIFLNCPYFWGKEPIGDEGVNMKVKTYVDNIWVFAFPTSCGSDDPLLNPVMDSNLSRLGCKRVLVYVAGKDVLRHRGWEYKEALGKCGWVGDVEVLEVEGEDHVFNLFNPKSDNAVSMVKRLASFVNR